MSDVLQTGDVFRHSYPFVRSQYEDLGEDGFCTVQSWKPGCRAWETYYSSGEEADGIGEIILTVIDIHKPGKYPTRVFFTRKWITPDGKLFGKTKLRMTTVPVFLRMSRGFPFPYTLADKATGAA